jgi:hypothetical protein
MASGVVGSRLEDLSTLLSSPLGERLLVAVSCGSVFMGANTVHRKWPELHGEEYRGTVLDQDAVIRALHAVFVRDIDSDLHRDDAVVLSQLNHCIRKFY